LKLGWIELNKRNAKSKLIWNFSSYGVMNLFHPRTSSLCYSAVWLWWKTGMKWNVTNDLKYVNTCLREEYVWSLSGKTMALPTGVLIQTVMEGRKASRLW